MPALPLLALTVARTIGFTVAGRGPNLKFVQLVPFGIRAIAVRNCQEFANPSARINI